MTTIIEMPNNSDQREGILHMEKGLENGKQVNALYNTGCTTAVNRKSLVTATLLTGNTKQYRMLDGTVCEAATASVYIDMLYFMKVVNALCLDDLTCDVIIGNILNAPE